MSSPSVPEFSPEEYARYSRHLTLPQVGVDGQRKLKAGSILLVGTGGLGSPLAMYLAAAGVGRLGLVDFDVVEHSNLHRQVIHLTSDIGRSKLHSARDTITDINPNVQVDLHEARLSSENAMDIIPQYDLVIDGTDNFPTRYLVNDACVLLKKTNVYGAIFRFEGQASVFAAGDGPCYRCLFPEPPPPGTVPSCAEGGVLGVLPGIVGLIQATEAIKLLLQTGQSLVGRLLLFDALRMSFRELKIRRDPDCPVCGDNPSVTALIDYEQFCGGATCTDTVVPEISVQELKRMLDAGESFTLIDVREPHEFEIGRIPSSQLIPLGDLPDRINELPREQRLVIHCKSGGRSAQAVATLLENDFTMVDNLAGGITAWSTDIDPSVPRY